MTKSIQDKMTIQYLSGIIPLPELDDTPSAPISSGVRIAKAKEIVLEKVFNMVKKVETRFNIQLPLEIVDEPSSVAVNDLIISFSSYRKHDMSITEYNCANSLRVVFHNPDMSVKHSDKNIFELYFSDDFAIVGGCFYSSSVHKEASGKSIDCRKLTVTFDESLSIVEYVYEHNANTTRTTRVKADGSDVLSFIEGCEGQVVAHS